MGSAIERDINKAMHWYNKSALQNNNNAQLNIAHIYEQEKNFIDYYKSLHWYHKAYENADKNDVLHAYAVLGIGRVYYKLGSDDDKYYKQAETWLRRAAAIEWPKDNSLRSYFEYGSKGEAQSFLGQLYHSGPGEIKQMHGEAIKWLSKAANNHQTSSQVLLAYKYLSGEGVPQNYVQASKWANIAASKHGLFAEKAKELRDILNSLMTPEQISEAQRLSLEFTSSNE